MHVEIKDMDAPSSNDGPVLSSTLDAAALALELKKVRDDCEQQFKIMMAEVTQRSARHTDKMMTDLLNRMREEIRKIGKPKVMGVSVNGAETKPLSSPASKVLPRLIINAKAGLHSMLVGPAGSGKTFAAHQLAEALGLPFASVCFTAGASETWLFGRQTPNGFIEGPFPKAFREGGVFLGDELDAADSNMLLCINTALANGLLYNPINGELIKQHQNFVFVAGANTAGFGSSAVYTGRNRPDGSTLTRFVKIPVDYDDAVEEMLCPDVDLREKLQSARKILRSERTEYIISSRCMDYAYRQRKNGVRVSDILESLTLGWPKEIVKKAGLDRWEEPSHKPVAGTAAASSPVKTALLDEKDLF